MSHSRNVANNLAYLSDRLGHLVGENNRAYGDSAGSSHRVLQILYPDCIRGDQYQDVMLMVRVIDKLSRIAQRAADGLDLGGESPWKDIAGYGLLGWEKDEARRLQSDAPGDESVDMVTHNAGHQDGAA